MTLNNIALFHKVSGNLSKALKFLSQAFEFSENPSFSSAILLNMCALHSQLNYHQDALNCGLQAVKILETNQEAHVPSLAAAYFNVCLEYEALDQPELSQNYLKKALDTSSSKLGVLHSISRVISSKAKTPVQSKLMALRPELQIKPRLSKNSRSRKTRTPQSTHKKSSSIKSSPYNSSSSEMKINGQTEHCIKPQDTWVRNIQKYRKIRPNSRNTTNNSRFLTGERMQPMFNEEQKPNQSFDISESYFGSVKPKNFRHNLYASPQRQDSSLKQGLSETCKKRINKITLKLNDLQNKIHEFSEKCKPIKEYHQEIEASRAVVTIENYAAKWIAKRSFAATRIQQFFIWAAPRLKFLKRINSLKLIQRKLKTLLAQNLLRRTKGNRLFTRHKNKEILLRNKFSRKIPKAQVEQVVVIQCFLRTFTAKQKLKQLQKQTCKSN
mmetsp:Transcript_14107/g.20639  ORF Transcript_14107/g.20639 Transcript_14107/m.20639 type:complete len:440 (+) Transcript_14107:148-1467(+)